MRRMRGFGGLIALLAMTLSLSEGLLAGVCGGDGASMVMDAHAGHRGMAPDGEAPPRSGGDTPDEAPRCPLAGAALTACGAGAVVATARVSMPVAFVATAQRLTASVAIPASRIGVDLFHPPRA